jgi:hypothetical protein
MIESNGMVAEHGWTFTPLTSPFDLTFQNNRED